MLTSDNAHIRLLASALLLTVVTQIFYIVVVSEAGPGTALRPITWFTELFAFIAVGVAGTALAIRRPQQAMLWTALGLSGLLNTLQVAIGLSMFAPAREGGAGEPQLFATILAGAFFLYFLAKLILGSAAFVAGLGALRSPGMGARALAAVTAIAGLAAAALNLLAMIDSQAWMFPAGAAGTVATALLAVLLLTAGMARGARETNA